jgi:hypothetical protein
MGHFQTRAVQRTSAARDPVPLSSFLRWAPRSNKGSRMRRPEFIAELGGSVVCSLSARRSKANGCSALACSVSRRGPANRLIASKPGKST